MYKVTLIGAGERGEAYCNALRERNDIQFCTVCDVNERAEKAAHIYGFRNIEKDYRKAISESRPDIVIVTVPAFLHCDVSIYALKNGANVLCEKPLDLSLKKCFELKNVIDMTGKHVAIGLQYHNIKIQRAVKHLFNNRLIGNDVVINYIDLREIRTKIAMRDAKTGNGGPLVDMTCHFVDLMRWFTGSDPDSVYSQWKTYSYGKADNKDIMLIAPDTGLLTITYESGDILNVNLCWGLPHKSGGYETFFGYGPKGYFKPVSYNSQEDLVIIGENEEKKVIKISVEEASELINPQSTVLNNLIMAIEGKGIYYSTINDGIISLATSLAALKSSITGRSVTIKEILEQMPSVEEILKGGE